MVNSKKMSKSKIAVIALALLLVLSLILTATGAWYTATKDTSDSGDSISIQMNDWISLSVTGDASGDSIKVKREIGGATATDVAAVSNVYYLFPGDYVEVDANTTINIEVTEAAAQACDFWYIVLDGTVTAANATKDNVKHFTTGGSKVLATFTTTAGETDDNNLLDAASVSGDVTTYTVTTSLTDTVAGKTASVAITGGSLDVRCCQYANLTAEEALAILCPKA